MPAKPGESASWLSPEQSAKVIERHLAARKRAIEEGREPPNLPPQDLKERAILALSCQQQTSSK